MILSPDHKDKLYPLTSVQRDVWFEQNLYPDTPVCNLGGYHRIEGHFDQQVFCRALRQLVQETEGLRIHLTLLDDVPMQSFPDLPLAHVVFVDCTREANPQASALAAIQRDMEQPFALLESPLFRYTLYKISEKYTLWSQIYHHLINDGRSYSRIVHAVAIRYNALLSGNSAPKEVNTPYRNFIDSDAAYLKSARFEQDRQFWQKQFATLPESLFSVRGEYAGKVGKKGIILGARYSGHMDGKHYAALETLAESSSATIFHALIALFCLYFSRTYRRDECVVGLPILNRDNAAKNSIGLFAGMIPVFFHIDQNASFTALMRSVGKTLREHYRHQRFPISEISRQAKLFESGRTRLFDLSLSLDQHDHSAMLGHIPLPTIALVHGFEQAPLALYIGRYGGSQDILLNFSGNLAYVDVEELALIEKRFLHLLDGVLIHPDQPIATLDLLPAAEKQKLLFDWNNTVAPLPEGCVHQLFEAQAERAPEATAVVFEDQTLTYAELNRQANQLAHYLISRGIQADDRIAIALERSPDMIVALLATLKAGGAYVPLDPDYPAERLAFILEDCQAQLLITHPALQQKLPACTAPLLYLGSPSLDHQPESNPKHNPKCTLLPQHLAYIIYTSGSTGRPKGVQIEHGAIAAHCLTVQAHYLLTPDDRVFQFASFSFDAAIEQILPTLCSGASLVLPPHGLPTTEELDTLLRRHRVTVLDLPPALFRLWAELGVPPADLRLILLGGEALPLDALAACAHWPQPSPRLINIYGPTEATISATTYEIPIGFLGSVVPIGRPLSGRQLYVLDPQGQPVPIGIPGELYLGGTGLACGYLNQPELTTEKFVPHPFSTASGARLYRTGDQVRYRPDGNLEFLGRLDDQIKLRGFRIELGEIESLLAEHTGVEAAVLTVHESDTLTAHVILKHHSVLQDVQPYHLRTVAQAPALPGHMEQIHAQSWPAFFAGDAVQTQYWSQIYTLFPDFQFVWLHADQIASVGNMVPLFWDGNASTLPSGWDTALKQAVLDRERGLAANTVCVLNGVVSPAFQGRNLSYLLIASMARIANRLGFAHLIAPVRPTLKHRFAEMPLSDYAALNREADGLAFDPWLRLHHGLGGKTLALSDRSQKVEGSLAQWQEWTGITFTQSGKYQIEGALQPVHIDVEQDHGCYYDQAIWVQHDLSRFCDKLPSLITPQQLRTHLAKHLPAHMLPARIELIDQFPLMPSGKIDRKTLAASATPPAPAAADACTHDALEEIVGGLWSSLLNQPDLARHAHFFELGGHSLIATQLTSRLYDALGITFPVRWVFETPRLHEFAARIRLALNGEGADTPASATQVPDNLILPETTCITPDLLPLIRLTQAEIDHIVATVEGGAANVADIYPLAPLQEGILFHHQWQTAGDTYISHILLAFDARERIDQFLAAFQSVIDRHDVLRSSIIWEGLSEPVQVVWRQAKLPVETRQFDPAAGSIADQLVESCHPRHTRLDLTRAPLRRVILAEDDGRWLLLLLAHHINEDHTSLSVLLQEIEAHQKGRLAQEPLPIPFRAFVHAARNGQNASAHVTFFRAMLDKIETPTLPFGLKNIQGDGSSIVEAHYTLPLPLSQRLRLAVQRRGATPAALCHLAWGVLLSRCCAQDEVVFGTVLFGRMHGGEGIERAFGLFINTLPIRIPGAGRSIAEALRETQQRLLALMRHEQAPLALALQCSSVPAPDPLFSSLLNYRHSREGAPIRLEGVELLQAEERSNFPIGLSIDDLGEGFTLTAQVDASIAADRICAFFHRILESLVSALEDAPQTLLQALDVLPPAEKDCLLVTWNQTATSLPHVFVHEWFEEQVLTAPMAAAIVFEQRVLSYNELNVRANQLAHHLIERGIGPDDRVAIALERSPEMIVALLATLKAGGAYVPLDPDYPAERLTFMLEDSGARLLITQAVLKERFVQGQGLPALCLDAAESVLSTQSRSNPKRPVAPHHLAYVIYTSGSTGRPKGIAIEHHGLVNLAQAHILSLGLMPKSRVLQFASFSFDPSVAEILMTLCSGAALYLPNAEQRAPGLPLWQFLDTAAITHLALTPSTLAALPKKLLPSLRVVLVGGEPCPPTLATYWSQDRRFFNAYGPTEVTVCASIAEYAQTDQSSDKPLPIGRPLANTQIYLLDKNQQLVPIGVPGELYIGGIGVARGYLNRPELTAERFIANPFTATHNPDDRLYRTGDLVRYRPDGNIDFLGRLDHQVKIRGFRIELGEIEAALCAHPAIREAVVLARSEGSVDQQLVAYVVSVTSEATPTVAALRTFMKATLPDYMLPAAFVFLETWPLTPNGKIDRKALPEPDAHLGWEAYQPPRDALEQQLVQIWEELLIVRPIGIEDNFFNLGGHSLLAVRLLAEMAKHFGKHLPISCLFKFPTIIGMAALLRKEGALPETSCLVRIRTQGTRPPLFFLPGIEGMIGYLYPLAQALDPEIPFFAFQACGLNGQAPPPASIEEMAEHYVTLLLEVQPHGPYFLAGHSFGGLVAFAMTQLLLARGETVGMLSIVDAFAPGTIAINTNYVGDSELILGIAQSICQMSSCKMTLSQADLKGHNAEDQLVYIAGWLEEEGLLPEGRGAEHLRNLHRVYQAHLRLHAQYSPESSRSLPITLFRASESPPNQSQEETLREDLGWGRYANQSVPVHYVPGNHVTMMTQAHVETLARLILNLCA